MKLELKETPCVKLNQTIKNVQLYAIIIYERRMML
jgi:hypothetical protein